MENSCVHIYYGGGKGKTTAALGQLIRALGAGKTVCYCQFLKSGTSSEAAVLRRLDVPMLFGSLSGKFLWQIPPEEKQEFFLQQRSCFDQAADAVYSGKYDLLVLDEVLDIVSEGILKEEQLVHLMEHRDGTELILTGRKPSDAMLGLCQYATHMHCEKHPFMESSQPARKGIEF